MFVKFSWSTRFSVIVSKEFTMLGRENTLITRNNYGNGKHTALSEVTKTN